MSLSEGSSLTTVLHGLFHHVTAELPGKENRLLLLIFYYLRVPAHKLKMEMNR